MWTDTKYCKSKTERDQRRRQNEDRGRSGRDVATRKGTHQRSPETGRDKEWTFPGISSRASRRKGKITDTLISDFSGPDL